MTNSFSFPIKRILVISLSNIGDIIMTFPVFDILKRDFPEARMDVIIGPKGKSLLTANPAFHQIYIYDKKQHPLRMLRWMVELSRCHYDLVVDLRNTAIPYLIFPKIKTPIMLSRPQGVHMRQQHLLRLQTVHPFREVSSKRQSIFFPDSDRKIVEELVRFSLSDIRYSVIAPGSRAHNKRWREDGFAKMADYLYEQFKMQSLFLGDGDDQDVIARVMRMMKTNAIDLGGRLSLTQSAYVMSHARLALVNDSGPMHLASYLNIPVAAFFGPTEPSKYGPWSDQSLVIRKNHDCLACQPGFNQDFTHDCTLAINDDYALKSLDPWLRELPSFKNEK